MNQIRAQRGRFRIKRILRWTLGVFFALIALVLLGIHIPAVQDKIATAVTRYLSDKTGGEFTVDKLRFSIFGDVSLDGLYVGEPDGTLVLDLKHFEVHTHLIGLLRNDIVLDDLSINGVDASLRQDGNALNIDFIIDAFSSGDTSQGEVAKHLKLSSNSIHLSDIRFSSYSDDAQLDLSCEALHLARGLVTLQPNEILVDSLLLRGTDVQFRQSGTGPSVGKSDTVLTLPPLDLYTSFDIDLTYLNIDGADIGYSDGSQKDSARFDPGNIDLLDLYLQADAIHVGKDGIGLNLEELSGRLNAIPIDSIAFQASVQATESRIKDFNLRAGRSNLTSSVEVRYADWVNLPSQLEEVSGTIECDGLLAKRDLEYLLPDSLLMLIKEWQDIRLSSAIGQDKITTTLKTLNLSTGRSTITSKGRGRNILVGANMEWEEVELTAKVGPEFAGTLQTFSEAVRLPPELVIEVNSGGSVEQFTLTTGVSSSWGQLNSSGQYGYHASIFDFDTELIGRDLLLDSVLLNDVLDTSDFDLVINGTYDKEVTATITGSVGEIWVKDQKISDILLNGRISPDSIVANIDLQDQRFPMLADVKVRRADTMEIVAHLLIDSFAIGKLTSGDTTLYASAKVELGMQYASDMFQGTLQAKDIQLNSTTLAHRTDSFDVTFSSTSDSSRVMLISDNLSGNVYTNFDLREFPSVIDSAVTKDLYISPDLTSDGYDFSVQLEMLNSAPLDLLNIDTDEFTSLRLHSRLNDQTKTFTLEANSGPFAANGLSVDTLGFAFRADVDETTLDAFAYQLIYDTLEVGSLTWDADRIGDVVNNDIRLVRDSLERLGIRARVMSERPDLLIFADSIMVLGQAWNTDQNAPIILNDSSVYFDNFTVEMAPTVVSMNGALDNFDLNINELMLVDADKLLLDREDLINGGILNAEVTLNAVDKSFDGEISIDSVRFYKGPPLDINMSAHSDGGMIPFEMKAVNDSNSIFFIGRYDWGASEIDMEAVIDVNHLESFEFITESLLEQMRGALTADVSITGPVATPSASGRMHLEDVAIVTRNPRTEFTIQDEEVAFTEDGISLDGFTLLDKNGTPLELNGQLETQDYRDFNYNLNIRTEDYVVIDNPAKSNYALQGLFAIGADIDVSGSRRDLKLDANVNISDKTNIAYVMPQKDVELITGAGIVDFVDPTLPEDSILVGRSMSYYDSIIASLPTLDLRSKLTMTDQSNFRVIVDPRSGDYVEASGRASVDLRMDRTGNVQMTGSYEITEGRYQLSFYNLAQKRFDIAKGSRIQWQGAPDQGTIDITAKHSVRTSSIGLVGNEVSENETYLYRRALPYTVSILIKGTIDQPEVSFSLDLPRDERLNYPVLDNKLSRLAQPEFESERNKQVFGLLVLGGFIPESSDDFDEMAVATTAIANSVNSLLAAQLNRLTNKIKGVDINIGLQSYSDFQSGEGMRTAAEFRVSKRLLDDRLSIEVGGELDVGANESSAYDRTDGFRSDITVVYDLTESGNTKLKAFNNETYDIIYHEIRNTGIALIFIREFDKGEGLLPRKKKK